MPIIAAIIFCIGLWLVKPEHLPPFLQIFQHGLKTTLKILRPVLIGLVIIFILGFLFLWYEDTQKEKQAKIKWAQLEKTQDSLNVIAAQERADLEEEEIRQAQQKATEIAVFQKSVLQKTKKHLNGFWGITFEALGAYEEYSGIYEFQANGNLYKEAELIGSWELEGTDKLYLHLNNKSISLLLPDSFYSSKVVSVTNAEEPEYAIHKNVTMTKRPRAMQVKREEPEELREAESGNI